MIRIVTIAIEPGGSLLLIDSVGLQIVMDKYELNIDRPPIPDEDPKTPYLQWKPGKEITLTLKGTIK